MDSLESPSLTCNDSPPELSDTEQEQTPQANNNSNAKSCGDGAYTLYAFSIFLSPILMSDQVSSIKIAWIFNFNHLILSFYTIFIGPLCEQFGTRKMAIFGGVASFLSLFLSAFAPTVDYLFFTYAVPAETRIYLVSLIPLVKGRHANECQTLNEPWTRLNSTAYFTGGGGYVNL
ncbi:hypothetical protein Avbf_18586 [Armadillidium vulgare]|nr:hypothetical protein Avbf_18586 [Armadillidium vulgare]